MSTIERWGPVCRGFNVSFPEGGRGRVEDIRLRDGAVELIVLTGHFARRLVTIAVADVEAILPRTGRLIVQSRHPESEDATGVDAAGGTVRMAARHSSRLSSPPEEAA